MRISVISFTKKGEKLSERLAKQLKETEVRLYTRCSRIRGEGMASYLEEDLKQWTGRQMEERNGLVFIGACGIAVRSVAPFLADKLYDSPVLVLDENGQYVIPILSGHMGGANELAEFIGKRMKALPVITTATDIHRTFAVDLFAKKNKLFIVNREGIAKVSSKVLAGGSITISIEPGHLEKSGIRGVPDVSEEKALEGSGYFKEETPLSKELQIPREITLAEYPPHQSVDVVVTAEKEAWDASLVLMPREYVIGMGCRKGKEAEKIEAYIRQALEETGILIGQVDALASIDLKSREEGFLSWSRKKRIPFLTYTAEELNDVREQVCPSEFVEQITGVDNVCERAALKAAGPGGKLIYGKHAKEGMTMAIAKRKWRVTFDET